MRRIKLKTRLLIAFAVSILVPLILGSLVFLGFVRNESRIIEKSYGVEGIGINEILGSVQFLSALNQGAYSKMQIELAENPNRILDHKYLEECNKVLDSQYSYLMVTKGSRIVYNGWPEGNQITGEMIPSIGTVKMGSNDGIYLGNLQSIVKRINCRTDRGDAYAALIVTKSGVMVEQIKTMAKDMMVSLLLVLVATAILLAWWLYQSIVNPLSRLSEATRNIKEGNLDFTMRGMEPEDEIGELYHDFEDMRQRLADQAEERLLSDKENKELISNISHDLKTPITAVKGYVEGIMDGVADTPEKMNRYIRTIYNKANEMDHLINELTFYTKIDSNRIPYTFNVLNVSAYFVDCAEELELELISKNFKLEYDNKVDPSVRIIADPEQLRRVINNIVGNSVKYMDKEYGIIRIEIRDAGDFIQVDLSDNGKGIAAKDLPFIFNRFYRTDSSRNSARGGSGIGLSIVKKIIEDHGGKIWANSRENIGTTMSFVIRKYQEVPGGEQNIDY